MLGYSSPTPRSSVVFHALPLLLVAVLVGCGGCASTPPEPAGSPANTPIERGSDSQTRPDALPPSDALIDAEVATVGWDRASNSPVVLLRSAAGRVVPIWIGLAEAQAIGRALHGIEPPRPMTHDLMANVLTSLDAELLAVTVSDLRDGVYYGWLELQVRGETGSRWVDTRPSDALALALRTGAAIRLATALVDDRQPFDFLPPEGPEQVVRAAGLTVVTPSAGARSELDLPASGGVLVTAVRGSAADAGIEVGDLIIALDGETIDRPLQLLDAVEDRAPGDALDVTFLRDGVERTVRVFPGLDTATDEPADIA
ncbi:MAG: bifunctional nuclease domain-containing protein [Acidobacteriota bacterium]